MSASSWYERSSSSRSTRSSRKRSGKFLNVSSMSDASTAWRRCISGSAESCVVLCCSSSNRSIGTFALWLRQEILRGWALTGRGDDASAAEQMRQGLAGWLSTGAQLLRPHFLALLADASEPTAGEHHELGTLDQALGLAESTGERFSEAEI